MYCLGSKALANNLGENVLSNKNCDKFTSNQLLKTFIKEAKQLSETGSLKTRSIVITARQGLLILKKDDYWLDKSV
ncbi:27232_t:CDS:2 [Dentiscutata erythropus]|uniref:27232_t:CDS:1 n=1 Tax=Dentiscutata erythropus TaxID=1348616 RepID=A0A9N9FXI7_9GLOM|nr:27232_t:CDS:2 [Dentiscutata erythropus]